MIFKTLLAWMILALFAMVHVRVMKDLIEPGMGTFPAYAVGSLIGSLLVIVIAIVFVSQNELRRINEQVAVGGTWTLLSLALFFTERIFLQGWTFSQVTSGFLSLEGIFFSLNLAVLAVSPILANTIFTYWDTSNRS